MADLKKRLKIEYKPVDELVMYANNPRKNDGAALDAVVASIKEFGFKNPIVIDKDNVIVAGHTRLKAAKRLKMTEVPTIMADDLTPAQIKAFRIADNKVAELADWDMELLEIEMSDIDLDMKEFGFDEKELAGILDADKEAEEDNFDVDEELAKPCFSKAGDIWKLGRHKVICGDSTLSETFEKLLGETKVNLVCTDAPYFVALKNKSGTIANDDLDDKQAYEFLMKCFTNFKEAMAKDASIYEFYAIMKTRVFYDAFEDAGFKVGAGLVWKKPRAPFMRTDWKFNMEPIIWGWRKDGKHIWYGDQKQTSVFEFDGIKDSEKEGCGHPSSKPVPLIAYLVKQCTQSNGLVLDGFLGSASTLIACDQLDRVCYGVELEPKFVDVAVKRYMASHEDSTKDIVLTRDGVEMTYEDAIAKMDETT